MIRSTSLIRFRMLKPHSICIKDCSPSSLNACDLIPRFMHSTLVAYWLNSAGTPKTGRRSPLLSHMHASASSRWILAGDFSFLESLVPSSRWPAICSIALDNPLSGLCSRAPAACTTLSSPQSLFEVHQDVSSAGRDMLAVCKDTSVVSEC